MWSHIHPYYIGGVWMLDGNGRACWQWIRHCDGKRPFVWYGGAA